MNLFPGIDPAIVGKGPHRIALRDVIGGCPPELAGLGEAVCTLGDATQRMTRALGAQGHLTPELAEPGHDVRSHALGREKYTP